MMKINNIENSHMSTTGDALLKMMQNNSTPALDLFVRESLQNSLDAAIKGIDYVKVNFENGEFETDSFAEHLPDVKNEINNLYPNKFSTFLSIKDTNTIGLVGNTTGIFDLDNDKDQNLGKLVFQIMKNQSEEGSGGCWGIGKTVYYRIGTGFVCYYSRIFVDGKYSERLVVSLVEDVRKSKAILRKMKNPTGVAFFGEYLNDEFNVITNSEYIHNFLKIFKIKPFEYEETGTVVIIPFTNEDSLLKDNMQLFEDINPPRWKNSIEEFVRISTLRWYFPRLTPNYKLLSQDGQKLSYLKAYINNLAILPSENEPIFQFLMDMYSTVVKKELSDKYIVEEVIRAKGLKSNVLGWLVYTKLTSEDLKINEYLPSPYEFTDTDNLLGNTDMTSNRPIIMYTRKPGMIMNYVTSGDWCKSNIHSKPNEFIIGLFVLNSYNTLSASNLKLEEYIRQGEKSDHIHWEDRSIDGQPVIKLVASIKNNINTILSNQFVKKEEVIEENSTNRVLGKRFAKLLMPNHNYGKEASIDKGNIRTTTISETKNTKIKMKDEVEFLEDGIKIGFNITSKSNCKFAQFNACVNTSNSYIDLSKWMKEQNEYIIGIESIKLKCISSSPEVSNIVISLNNDANIFENKFKVVFNKVNGITTGITLENIGLIDFKLAIEFEVKIFNQNYQFTFKSKVIEGSE